MGDTNSKIKIWCWVIGIIAISILSVVLFCHIAYWLMWVGAITVGILAIVIAILLARGARKIKQDINS